MFEFDYSRNLINLINAKRRQSISEYAYIDLNEKSIEEIYKWYDNILALIQENPPLAYVKGITLKENATGNAEEIIYKYCDKPSVSLSITILEI